MARETLPKERVPRTPSGIPWGDPRWGVNKDETEMKELVRKREGCVGDDGIRTIRMSKTGAEWDDPRLEAYEERGYTVRDAGRRYELSIPQSEWEKQEQKRIATTLAANPKPQGDRTFRVNSEEEMAPVSTRELLTLSSEG